MWSFFTGTTLLVGCQPTPAALPPDEDEQLLEVVAEYITTYQERKDWDKLLSFYSDSLYFLDINMQMEFTDKAGFMSFYDWPNPNFRKLSPDQKSFLVEDIIVKDRTAVIKGRFQPFYWKDDLREWTDLFTIWLHFNEDLKIIRQYDFIKYPKQFLPE